MAVARAEASNEAEMYDSLRILVRTATTLRRMVGEDVVASDYQAFAVEAGVPFAPETMADEYAPAKRANRAGVQVVGSVALGLLRSESGSRVAISRGKGELKILVKPQVVLETIADDLDL